MAALGGFDAGNVSNTVDFSGSITPSENNKWVWAVGQGYGNFSHKTYDLTDNGRKLTITASENMPLLVGKVTEAFEGGPGLSPQIAFGDSKGSISPVWAADNAEGTMTLTVHDTNQQEIGTMTLNVNAFAPVAWSKTDASQGVAIRYMNNSAGSFTGSTGVFAKSPNFATVNAILNAFGAPTLQEIQGQIKSYPGLSGIDDDTSDVVGISGDAYDASGWAYAGAYALGVLNGKTLELNFNSPVNTGAETDWKASLTMQISYS
ncbi:hypothetical protein ABK350_004736, partial [Escherichia coli]